MKPECTADCESRDMLDAAVAVLAIGACPFIKHGKMHDGVHVDVGDPECYYRVLEAAGDHDGAALDAECRACVREALEELAIARKEAQG